jgi:peptide deformylase
MKILPIVAVNKSLLALHDISLRKKSEPVDVNDSDALASAKLVINELFRALYNEPSGLAIAAPQIGVQLQITAIDFEDKELRKRKTLALINPKIINYSTEEEDDEEICLSVPNFSGKIARAKKISVEAFDYNGQPIQIEAEGFFARVLQHEIDHLNGFLYIDKAKGELEEIPDFPDRRVPGTLKKLE